MAHALDFDDGSGLHIPLHPSVPVVPAVIALGEFFGRSGAQVLEAFVCGTEVECKLARGSSRASYDAGWHATGVFGTMGAAAAASRLVGLSPAQAGTALGIALSHASGSRQNFGTMVKPLHAGTAAMNGIVSAYLARDGYTASDGALEGPFGFGKLFGGNMLVEECGTLGRPFHLANGFSIKKYPSCYSTHSGIDAILEILRKNPVDYRDIKEINCWVHPNHIAALPYKVPIAELEGKFSMPFVLAVACIYGSVELSRFVPDVLRDARVIDLCTKVNFLPDESLPPMGARVSIASTGNEVYSAATERPRGHPLNPLTQEEVETKFRSCAGLLLSRRKTETVLEMLLHLEEVKDINSFVEAIGDR
jgi:2-methylcitrate dehydratase PrpD